jgi:hypothetical protein
VASSSKPSVSSMQPNDMVTFFRGLDRRLTEVKEDEEDNGEPTTPAPIDGDDDDAARRRIEQHVATLDKQLVLLGYGEGDLDRTLAERIGDRLAQVNDDDWDTVVQEKEQTVGSSRTLIDHVRSVVGEIAAELRSR